MWYIYCNLFFQVQFRLKQIVDASAEEKEKLLIELEEFANRGIPDARQNLVSAPCSKVKYFLCLY